MGGACCPSCCRPAHGSRRFVCKADLWFGAVSCSLLLMMNEREGPPFWVCFLESFFSARLRDWLLSLVCMYNFTRLYIQDRAALPLRLPPNLCVCVLCCPLPLLRAWKGGTTGLFGSAAVVLRAGRNYEAGEEFFVSYGPKGAAGYLEENGCALVGVGLPVCWFVAFCC